MAKTPAPVFDDLETPEVINLDNTPKANFSGAMKSNPVSKVDSLTLDLSEDEEDFQIVDEPDLNRYVVAKYIGTTGSPDGHHTQTIQGNSAVFPLNKHVVVKYLYVKAARRSGFVDFVQNPGKKNMKKVDNLPTFIVQNVIPDEYQSDSKIMDYIDAIEQSKGKRLMLACESL